jgi:hypothetical protein
VVDDQLAGRLAAYFAAAIGRYEPGAQVASVYAITACTLGYSQAGIRAIERVWPSVVGHLGVAHHARDRPSRQGKPIAALAQRRTKQPLPPGRRTAVVATAVWLPGR